MNTEKGLAYKIDKTLFWVTWSRENWAPSVVPLSLPTTSSSNCSMWLQIQAACECAAKPGVSKGKKDSRSEILWVEVNGAYALGRSELDFKHSLYFVKLNNVTVILMVKILLFPVYVAFYPITCWPHSHNCQEGIPLKVKAFLFHFFLYSSIFEVHSLSDQAFARITNFL